MRKQSAKQGRVAYHTTERITFATKDAPNQLPRKLGSPLQVMTPRQHLPYADSSPNAAPNHPSRVIVSGCIVSPRERSLPSTSPRAGATGMDEEEYFKIAARTRSLTRSLSAVYAPVRQFAQGGYKCRVLKLRAANKTPPNCKGASRYPPATISAVAQPKTR